GLHALPGAFAEGRISKTGRYHERLLRAANNHVYSPTVHVEVGRSQPGDGIYDEQCVIALRAHKLGNLLDVMPRAGGTFRRLHIDSAHAWRQILPNFVERKRLTVRHRDQLDGAAKSLGEVAPAFAKFSGGEHKYLVPRRGQIGDRAFHHTGAGASQHQNVVLRADEVL